MANNAEYGNAVELFAKAYKTITYYADSAAATDKHELCEVTRMVRTAAVLTELSFELASGIDSFPPESSFGRYLFEACRLHGSMEPDIYTHAAGLTHAHSRLNLNKRFHTHVDLLTEVAKAMALAFEERHKHASNADGYEFDGYDLISHVSPIFSNYEGVSKAKSALMMYSAIAFIVAMRASGRKDELNALLGDRYMLKPAAIIDFHDAAHNVGIRLVPAAGDIGEHFQNKL